MHEAPPSLSLGERVATVADGLGIRTALIGALALAHHGYVRATEDLDLAASLSSFEPLRALEAALVRDGLHTRLTYPDDADALGGVLRVWERVDDDGEPVEPVEIVNFYNPLRPRQTPATAAIREATPIQPGSALRCVPLAYLVALKLATHARRDQGDVIEVLRHNPDADVDEIRAVCKQYGLDAAFDDLLEP